jgi:hypothetical protein
MEKPVLSAWQISNMSFGFFGIQFGWGLQLANMSAIYEDTPLDHAQKLKPIFGSAPAAIEGKEAHVTIPATSVAIFTAR